jgi:hypothetical protein
MPVYSYTINFQDEAGRNSRAQGFLDGADEADILAQLETLVVNHATLSGALVTGVNYARPLDPAFLTAVTTAVNLSGGTRPLADHDVEKGGRFIWRTEDGDTHRITIPAIRGTFVTPGGEIDQVAAAVDAFITNVTGGDNSDEDGNDVTALVKAYKVFKDRGQV